MKVLVLADLQWVELDDWNRFLTLDQSKFDAIFLLGDINQIMLERISVVFNKKPMVGVLGDFGFPGDLEYYGMTDCHGRQIVLNGVRIVGVEGANRYKAGPYPMHTQEEIEEICRELPDSDFLLCHNSPKGFHDREGHPVYQGFTGLNAYIERNQPRYLFHGHHHVNAVDQLGHTTLIGVFGGIIFDTESGDIEYVLKQNDVGKHG